MNATLAIAGLFLGFGCSTDDTLTDYEVQQMINNSLEGQWTIVNITVSKEDWIWNDNKSQWEAGPSKVCPNSPRIFTKKGHSLLICFWGHKAPTKCRNFCLM